MNLAAEPRTRGLLVHAPSSMRTKLRERVHGLLEKNYKTKKKKCSLNARISLVCGWIRLIFFFKRSYERPASFEPIRVPIPYADHPVHSYTLDLDFEKISLSPAG